MCGIILKNRTKMRDNLLVILSDLEGRCHL